MERQPAGRYKDQKRAEKINTFQNIRKTGEHLCETADVSFVFSYGAESWCTGAYGDSSDQGNPLPLNVQEQIEAYPGSMICGEVEQYENTEFSQSVYLKKTYLIHQSKKFPIENVRIFLKKEEDLKPGMRILVKGTLKRVEGPAESGGL